MKPSPWVHAETWRRSDISGYRSNYGDRFGIFEVPYKGGVILYCVVTDGDQNYHGLGPEYEWEHVSVSTRNRTPNWYEMAFIKDVFWSEDETVMQLHVPKSDHRNLHPHVLHLWRPRNAEIPRPPVDTVA
jgi:hypothetical protein